MDRRIRSNRPSDRRSASGDDPRPIQRPAPNSTSGGLTAARRSSGGASPRASDCRPTIAACLRFRVECCHLPPRFPPEQPVEPGTPAPQQPANNQPSLRDAPAVFAGRRTFEALGPMSLRCSNGTSRMAVGPFRSPHQLDTPVCLLMIFRPRSNLGDRHAADHSPPLETAVARHVCLSRPRCR